MATGTGRDRAGRQRRAGWLSLWGALVLLALAFDVVVLAPSPQPLVEAMARDPLFAALSSILPARALLFCLSAVHALATPLVFLVIWLSIGWQEGAWLGAALYAVSPEHAIGLNSGEALRVFPAVALALGSLGLALDFRPRLRLSAALLALAVLFHPSALPALLVIGLARRRMPWLHLLALPLAGLGARTLAVPGPASPAGGAYPMAVLASAVDGLRRVVPVGEAVGVALLALALAVAVARGPLSQRVSVWCAALLASAPDWPLVLRGLPGSPAGGHLLLVVPAAALVSELWLLAARRGAPRGLLMATGSALVVACAVWTIRLRS